MGQILGGRATAHWAIGTRFTRKLPSKSRQRGAE